MDTLISVFKALTLKTSGFRFPAIAMGAKVFFPI